MSRPSPYIFLVRSISYHSSFIHDPSAQVPYRSPSFLLRWYLYTQVGCDITSPSSRNHFRDMKGVDDSTYDIFLVDIPVIARITHHDPSAHSPRAFASTFSILFCLFISHETPLQAKKKKMAFL